MSMLWWQNGRDIDWFSTNLEKWIKPTISSNPNNSHSNGGRYSKLKSCRLSKTCQTMMYIPQEQQPRDLTYEEQLARFQDQRPYKYSQRQQHYNSHYNYIRTSARRAYYKPETHEIVLADAYDKIQKIQRQNKAKNYDYLLLLQQFLRQQERKATNKGAIEDIGTLTTYLNNNIQQYEQTEQTITLKQFLQEGIQKHENENLMTLKEFLQENTDKNVSNQNDANKEHTENVRVIPQNSEQSEPVNNNINANDNQKEITLQEFLEEGCKSDNKKVTFSSTNPFITEISTTDESNKPFIFYENKDDSNKNITDAVNDESFEEFFKQRQTAGDRTENSFSKIQKINNVSPKPVIHKVAFNMKSTVPQLNSSHNSKSNKLVDKDEKISFDDFLKERSNILSQHKSASEENKEMTLEEFLQDEDILKSEEMKLSKSNEQGTKNNNNKHLKLSKSFNDKTNLIKENLIKKLTRNELLSEKNRRNDQEQENNNTNRITLYEFLKEEEQKQTTAIENGLKNLKLRTHQEDSDMFYEINNNAPEIKINDNFIQVETQTQPCIKYSQYENNRQVCACDTQFVLTSNVYNQNCNQLLSNIDYNKIEFIDRSYDYHRTVHQNDVLNSYPFQQRSCNKLFNSVNSQGRKCKSKSKIISSPVRGVMEDGVYGPLWPSVLLTYDKVVSPHKVVHPNESYA